MIWLGNYVRRLFFVFCLMAALSGMTLAQEAPPTSSEKHDAEKAWEALIKAKGGREKLHSVTNFLIDTEDFTQLDILQSWTWHYHYWATGAPVLTVTDL